MNAIVIEHVKVGDLPESWRTRLGASLEGCVTVRIEPEAEARIASDEDPDDPLFGMWRDRGDMSDVNSYVRRLRAPRY